MRASAVKVSEAGFTRTVIEYAKARGWLVAHFRPARTSRGWRTAMSGDVGFPDLLLVRIPRTVAAELKVGRNAASLPQLAWLAGLRASRVEAYIWRPEQWPDIERILA